MSPTRSSRNRQRCRELLEQYYPSSSRMGPMERYRAAIEGHVRSDTALLDAGCGDEMPMTREIHATVGFAVGVDMERPSPPSPGPHACAADLNALPFRDDRFDVVISLSVIEHLRDPGRVFREFYRVLRPGGTLIVQTPNRWDYVSVIAAATPSSVHRWLIPRITSRPAEDVFPTFYRANTRAGLAKAMQAAGLVCREVSLFNQYPAYLMFSPLLFRLGVLWERLTSRLDALAFLRGWILLVAEKPTRPEASPKR